MLFLRDYFFIQQLSFKLCGIDIKAANYGTILQRPLLCYIPLVCAISHIMAMLHHAYVNCQDFVEVTETLAIFFQSALAISKMLIFLVKRGEFLKIVSNVNLFNLKGNFRFNFKFKKSGTKNKNWLWNLSHPAVRQEVPMIVNENTKEIQMSNIYFRSVLFSGIMAFVSPICEAVYFYFVKRKLILRVPYKARWVSATQSVWFFAQHVSVIFLSLAITLCFM